MIKKLDHVTINVKDIAATRRFYTELLGMSEKKIVDCHDHRYYLFSIDDSTILEVGQYDFDTSAAHSTSTASGKIRHIALEVDDIAALEAKLAAAGFYFETDVAYRGDELGFISGQILDPNGIELEFLQYRR